MTTTSFSCNYSMSTDSTFRAWVSAIITALSAVGMVQTSDTGQINTSTVSTTAATVTAQGYAIFRFNDTAQSTYPLFLKIEFGNAGYANAAGTPGIWLTIGKGTDGAGTITGTLLARRLLSSSYNNSTNSGSTSLFSGVASAGDNWCALIPWLNMNGSANSVGSQGFHSPFFTIERINSGAGIVVCTAIPIVTNSVANGLSTTSGTVGPYVDTINYSTGVAITGYAPVLLPGTVGGTRMGPTTSLGAGAVGPVFPWIVIAQGLAPDQCVNTLSYPAGDTPGSTFTATLNGVTRTYYPIPLSDAHNSFGFSIVQQTNATNDVNRYVGLCIRWD